MLHEQNVILTRSTTPGLWLTQKSVSKVKPLVPGLWQARVHYGFEDAPHIPHALTQCREQGLKVKLFETSYFLSRQRVVPSPGAGMADWRERLFAGMSRNACSVAEFFRLPNNSVIVLGTRVQI